VNDVYSLIHIILKIFIRSGNHKFYIQFLRQLGLESFRITLYKVPYQGYEIDALINFSTPVVRSEKSKLGKRCRKNGRLLRWENVPEILHNRQQNEI
jgi:hypothetical protein